MTTRHLSEEEAQRLLEGALPGEERSGVSDHLASCAGCQALVSSFQALEDALSLLPAAEPPPDFTAGVLALIDLRERSARRERRVALGVLGAVAAALAATVALAGQAAWAPALSEASASLVQGVEAARISRQVLSPLLGALRAEIVLGCAALGLPLLLGLSRLVPARAQRA
ncbi:MAG TPA: anti-sigma factor [Anaeromyxobacteraceae bacterium]|nr:anti-sigma factor [Anaeromyxobacteraceae bacterium]